MSLTEMFSLEGKVAMVPGGGGGIGSALAAALARPARAIAVDRPA